MAQPDVDKTGASDIDMGDILMLAKLYSDRLRQNPRRLAEGLGQNHRRVGRDVAVCGIARGFCRDLVEVDRPLQGKIRSHRIGRGADAGEEVRKQIHSNSLSL